MAPNPYTIIPAQPGYFVICGDGGELFEPPHEAVIAWRIETEKIRDDWHHTTFPITTDGTPPSNYVALLHPSGQVTMLDGLHENFAVASDAYRDFCTRRGDR